MIINIHNVYGELKFISDKDQLKTGWLSIKRNTNSDRKSFHSYSSSKLFNKKDVTKRHLTDKSDYEIDDRKKLNIAIDMIIN